MLRPRAAPAAALAAALGLAALAACSDPPEEVCPGTAVATFSFAEGARLPAGDAALAGRDPDPALPDCPAAVGYTGGPLPAFRATLAFDAGPQVAALCRAARTVLRGSRTGTRYTVEAVTDGAALPGCSTGCAAVLRAVVAGDVTVDGTGTATAFDGALVEIVTRDPGTECGTCLADAAGACAARYLLHGTP